jgi:hypothetical protein
VLTEERKSKAMGIEMEELPKNMSLSALTDCCMSEINNYRRGEPFSDQYCLEIFRRALFQNDHVARALIQDRFMEFMLGSLRRHPNYEAASGLDSPENYAAKAFERFWLAAVHNQQLAFTTLAAALRYMRGCLNGAILDTLRAYARTKDLALPEPGFAGEPAVEDYDDGPDLWEITRNILPSPREQRLAYLLFYCNLRPREIVRLCPEEFSNVQEIYHLRRNIVERLLRNADQIRWRLNPH